MIISLLDYKTARTGLKVRAETQRWLRGAGPKFDQRKESSSEKNLLTGNKY